MLQNWLHLWISFAIILGKLGYYVQMEVATEMNKRLGRLLHTQVWIYFVLLCGFVLGAVLLEQYWLAGVEALITVIAFFVYAFHRRSRLAGRTHCRQVRRRRAELSQRRRPNRQSPAGGD